MLRYLTDFHEPVKTAIDITSIGVLVATVAQWLPAVAALLTVIWGALRVYGEVLEIQKKRRDLQKPGE